MSVKKDIVILANSIKQGGRCLAGRFVERNSEGRWMIGDWCRPVMPDENGHDSIPDTACAHFNPLDVVSIVLERRAPVPGQPENWLWDHFSAITHLRSFNSSNDAPRALEAITEFPSDIWIDSSAARPDEFAAHLPIVNSLNCVRVQGLWLNLTLDDNGRKRIHAEFTYGGHLYEKMAVTDPLMFRILARQFPEPGLTRRMQLRNGDSYNLTVSIGMPFGPRHVRYKFVAAIIDQSGYIQREYR